MHIPEAVAKENDPVVEVVGVWESRSVRFPHFLAAISFALIVDALR